MTLSAWHALAQLAGLAALAVGVWMLAGLAWTLTVIGGGVLLVSVAAELSRTPTPTKDGS